MKRIRPLTSHMGIDSILDVQDENEMIPEQSYLSDEQELSLRAEETSLNWRNTGAKVLDKFKHLGGHVSYHVMSDREANLKCDINRFWKPSLVILQNRDPLLDGNKGRSSTVL